MSTYKAIIRQASCDTVFFGITQAQALSYASKWLETHLLLTPVSITIEKVR